MCYVVFGGGWRECLLTGFESSLSGKPIHDKLCRRKLLSPLLGAMKKILFFLTEDWFFCSHFRERALGAKAAGFDVVVLARDTGCGREIQASGLRFVPLAIRRSGVNPLREMGILFQIWRHYHAERPDIVHHIAMKPIIYGTAAALFTRIQAVVNAPVGLGFVFTADTLRARLLRMILAPALRLLINPERSKVVFENEDDLKSFVDGGSVRAGDAVLIRGAGIDLTKFRMVPEPEQGPVVVILTARMLWDKGIREFVEAASLIKKQGAAVRFLLVGSPDPDNPASISQKILESWANEGGIEWLGHRTDIAELLAASHIVCLPSYREGLPKSLLEALACGRPIVTTDVPGCRETVRPGYNGRLVPARDPVSLAGALLQLIQNPAERKAFGTNGRKMAEEIFASELIVGSTIRLYESLGIP